LDVQKRLQRHRPQIAVTYGCTRYRIDKGRHVNTLRPSSGAAWKLLFLPYRSCLVAQWRPNDAAAMDGPYGVTRYRSSLPGTFRHVEFDGDWVVSRVPFLLPARFENPRRWSLGIVVDDSEMN
jgi:hypothetical protein